MAAFAADLLNCVHLATLGIKGLTKSVTKICTFSQCVQSQYSVHFLNVLLHPQFFVHPFLQRHFVEGIMVQWQNTWLELTAHFQWSIHNLQSRVCYYSCPKGLSISAQSNGFTENVHEWCLMYVEVHSELSFILLISHLRSSNVSQFDFGLLAQTKLESRRGSIPKSSR